MNKNLKNGLDVRVLASALNVINSDEKVMHKAV